MSPFRSKSQMRAAFGGYLGPEMKAKAKEFADATPNINKLPNKVTRRKTMAKPNSKAPLGQGGRFAALKAKIAKRGGVRNPAAVAAAVGRKKYGKKKFQQLSAKGLKKRS